MTTQLSPAERAMAIWHRITEEATASNDHGVIYDGEKIAEIIGSAIERAIAEAVEANAWRVHDEFVQLAEFYAKKAKEHTGAEQEILMAKGQAYAEAIAHLRVHNNLSDRSQS